MSELVEPILTYWVPRFLLNLRDSALKAEKASASSSSSSSQSSSFSTSKPSLTLGGKAFTPPRESYPVYKVINKVPLRPDRNERKKAVTDGEIEVPVTDDTFPRRRVRIESGPEGKNEQCLSSPSSIIKRLYHLPTVPRKFMSEGVKKEMEKNEARTKGRSASRGGGGGGAGRESVDGNGDGQAWAGKRKEGVRQRKGSREESSSGSSCPSGMSRSESTDSVASSVFMGGTRCETLLQMLCNEERSGGVFREFLREKQKILELKCLNCWEKLQEFRVLHYEAVVKTEETAALAKNIFLDFVRKEGKFSIGCAEATVKEVRACFHDLIGFTPFPKNVTSYCSFLFFGAMIFFSVFTRNKSSLP